MSDPAAPVAPAAPAAPAAPVAPTPWFNGADADTTAYLTARGFDKMEPGKAALEAINAHRNAEKLLGVPADQVLKLPKADAPDAEWAPVFERLGVPKEAKGYEIKIDGADEAFVDTARGWFKDAGVPAKRAQKLAENYMAYAKTIADKQAQDGAAKIATETAALKAEWGANYDKHVGAGKAAALAFGVPAQVIDALQGHLGFAGVMKFFHQIGTKLGSEGRFASGDNKVSSFGMTAEQARTEIAALKADRGFVAKFGAGDADARSKMDRLHKIANAG